MKPTTRNPHNRWRRSVSDPVLFCREFLELEPHPGQVSWLDYSTRSQNLLVTGNRWGKSTIQAAKMIHRAIFRIRDLQYDQIEQYRVLNVSITQDQANIIFRKCLSLIRRARLIELLVKDVTYTPFPKIEFGNGSEITARSSQNRGEYILGNDYDYINYDEVAFELHPDYVVDEILTMRLADRKGTLDLVSTPRGKNWFYRKSLELQANQRLGYVQSGRSTDNPHLNSEYLTDKIATLPQDRVQQNIYGMFVDSGDEIIGEEYLRQALASATGLAERIPHHRYVHGWDLARKLTFTVGVTLDVTAKPYQLVKLERFQRRDWPTVFEVIRKRARDYGGETIIDSTGLGDVVLAELGDIKPIGFIFTGSSKPELLTNLQSQFESGNIAVPYIETGVGTDQHWSFVDELREFGWQTNPNADAAMALALALWMMRPTSTQTETPGFRLGEV